MDWQLASLGGARVALARHDGDGEPMVLVGAWPQTLEAWARVWERLGDRTRLALDLPGFGHSAPVPTTPSSCGAFLVAALDELGWDRVHLVAPDVGVPVALWVAHHHPERLHSLVLSDGPGTWPPSLSRDLGWMVRSRLLRWLLGLDPARFVNTAMGRGYVAGAPDAPERSVAAYRDKLPHTLGFLASYPTELPRIAASASILTPTLVLWGGDDVFVPADNAHAIADALPHSRRVVLEGVGHFSHDDAPDAYARELVAWVDGHVAHELPGQTA
ncbi:MAG: alpha/beta hydrolase [Myxococcales bacterium]|nr:alpha/beta hydrolase [Myxococcales bacterium]